MVTTTYLNKKSLLFIPQIALIIAVMSEAEIDSSLHDRRAF